MKEVWPGCIKFSEKHLIGTGGLYGVKMFQECLRANY